MLCGGAFHSWEQHFLKALSQYYNYVIVLRFPGCDRYSPVDLRDWFGFRSCTHSLFPLAEHVGDVRGIVQRAVKDLLIEESLKTYEEVWLSKVFELRDHVRNKAIANQNKQDRENKKDSDENIAVS